MQERRKIKERRVNAPKEGLPLYYARNRVDRRQSHRPTAASQSADFDIDLLASCLVD